MVDTHPLRKEVTAWNGRPSRIKMQFPPCSPMYHEGFVEFDWEAIGFPDPPAGAVWHTAHGYGATQAEAWYAAHQHLQRIVRDTPNTDWMCLPVEESVDLTLLTRGPFHAIIRVWTLSPASALERQMVQSIREVIIGHLEQDVDQESAIAMAAEEIVRGLKRNLLEE